MKASFWLLMAASLVLAGCSPRSTGGTNKTLDNQVLKAPTAAQPLNYSQYPDLGPAPELVNESWLNSAQPLRLAGLRGKVVLLDMWTFDCINCQHVVPVLQALYQKYAAQGLVVIGNHFPEFGYEKELGNLKDAIQRLGITYPVDQDNDGKTWNAYHNEYWPTVYLIDKQGHIRFTSIGEGNYPATEDAILMLLKEPAS